MQKEKPFGIELVAALNAIIAVWSVLYTDRHAFILFQAGLGIISAIGLWMGKAWGWWAAISASLLTIGFSLFALSKGFDFVALAIMILLRLLPLIYLLLPGVRAAMGVGKKA